jgi:hypothetical protein
LTIEIDGSPAVEMTCEAEINRIAGETMSMARLWRDHGKRDEARDLLAPVYGWVTEGFDTPI